MVLLPGPAHDPPRTLSRARRQRRHDCTLVDLGIPNVQVRQVGEFAHVLEVAPRGGPGRLGAEMFVGPEESSGHIDAGREAISIPVPRPGKCLLEIFEAKREAALGRREGAKVGEVRVAAGLRR